MIKKFCENRQKTDLNSHRGAYQNVINFINELQEKNKNCNHYFAEALGIEICIYCGTIKN